MRVFMDDRGFGVGGDGDAVGFQFDIPRPDEYVLEEEDAFRVSGVVGWFFFRWGLFQIGFWNNIYLDVIEGNKEYLCSYGEVFHDDHLS